jgi:glycosyltransferase involved in cell wall biosynthesis
MIKKNLFFVFLTLLLQAFTSLAIFQLDTTSKHSVCIVIPAYNEESRIERTLEAYVAYFKNISYLQVTLLVVANNCSDNTVSVCRALQAKHSEIQLLDLIPGGKGFAVKQGFILALKTKYDLIGFVDADMATEPQYFHDIILATDNHDGAIASRYCKGANLTAARPFLRKISGKIFNWVVQKRFKFTFQDTQCGAKIFTRETIQAVVPHMVENKWYFDIELLYLCTLHHKDVVEIPTTWEDQPGSHLKINGALIKEFIYGQGRVLKRHKKLAKEYVTEKRIEKKQQQLSKKQQRQAEKKAARAARAEKKAAARAKKRAQKEQRAAEKRAARQKRAVV